MDVHIPRAVSTALRLRGIDVLTAQQDGAERWEDDALLMRATALERILVTQDDDLLREGAKLQR
jgi:predicted nuclease of predicted toxin-antitoxin system